MFRAVTTVVGVLMLSGCVSTKIVPVKDDQIARLQGGTIAITTREKPAFAAMTAGKAMFGLLGAAAMISTGNKIVADNAVEDPAKYIGQKLATGLADQNSLRRIDIEGAIATTNNPAELAKQYSSSNVLLDVETVNWSFTYFPTDFDSYRVVYSAKVRMIDTKTGKLLAEGFCARVPEKSDTAPSRDELLANEAARLKQELAVAADYCVNEFQAKVFNLPVTKTAYAH